MTTSFFYQRFLYCAFLICFFTATLASASGIIPIKLKYISTTEGLSNSTIQCIFQDSYGFMWFGTRDGLNKYDGYQVTVYKTALKDQQTISNNFVRCVYEDSRKNLWVGTANGLNLLNRKKGTFTRFKHQLNIAGSISNNFINFINEDSHGRLWIGTEGGGLNIFNGNTQSFVSYIFNSPGVSDLHTGSIRNVFEDHNRQLWVTTNSGLNRLNTDTHTLSAFPLDGEKSIGISVIREDVNGKLWVGTGDKGLFVIDQARKKVIHYSHNERDSNTLKSDGVSAIAFDRIGNVWIGCANGGLNLLKPNENIFYHYKDDDSYKSGSLFQRTVSALYNDKQNNLWIGTHRGGVKLYSPVAQKFELHQQGRDDNSLSFNDVKAFYEDATGTIWIGADGGGLNKYNTQNNSFKHFRHSSINPRSISSDAVTDINEDGYGNLLVATWGGGLNIFNKVSGTFSSLMNHPDDNSSISSNYVIKILKDRTGNFWIGTYYGGLNVYNSKTKTFRKIIQDPSSKTSLSGNNIIALNEDKVGNIWIATDDGGLNCYDIRSNSFRHYFLGRETPPNIEVVFTDHQGKVWVGQSGLFYYNPNEDKFIAAAGSGLSEETIKGIIEDDRGYLWISTLNGLIKYNSSTGKSVRYNQADGLQSDEFEPNAVLKSSKNELYFGGINGFNNFSPDSISTNKYLPPVYFTSFQIFNKTILPNEKDSPLKTDVNFVKEIVLNYDQSTFSFTFAGLNYAAANNNNYAYKLEPFDKQWNNVGHERKATYTNIDPGEYTLRVKASNNDGYWNNKMATVKIIIRPPFMKSLWFRLLAGLLIITVVYKAISFRRKLELDRIKKKNDEELHQIQLQFFTNISHELRTPLTLIMGRLEKMVRDEPGSYLNSNFGSLFKNANRLMNLINELMDFRKVESAALKLKAARGNIAVFVDEVTDEFLVLAHEKQLNFQLKKLISFEEAWFDRQIIEKIILNLIHNAIKYTPRGGKICVELSDLQETAKSKYESGLKVQHGYAAKRYFFIKVADTGIGITKNSLQHLFERYYRVSESHLGSGIGLAFVKSLILLHKGEIQVFSEKDKGTEVVIAIPCDQDDYTTDEKWQETPEQRNVRLESVIPALEYPANNTLGDIHALMEEITADAIKKHILIVDDNDEVRELIRETLGPFYQISEAANGMEGFEKAKSSFPDLIISDMMMPVANGIDFCKMVREDIETSHVPFLLLSAKDTVDSKIEGIGSGADFYFSKPINFSILGLTIRNIFEQRQKLKNHYSRDHQIEVRELAHSVLDKKFIDKMLVSIEARITDPNLDADYLSYEMCMSKTKLYNKIKGITGQSIGEFVRTVRLTKAKDIMIKEDTFITEVMFRVGIQTQSYFTRAFKKEFGKTPTQYIHEMKQNLS